MSRYEHFYAQVNTFHEQWTRFFRARSFTKARMRPEDFDQLPAFSYAEEPLRAVLGRTWAPLVGLWGLGGGLLAMALVAYRRYQAV
jgi:hypothetical protein